MIEDDVEVQSDLYKAAELIELYCLNVVWTGSTVFVSHENGAVASGSGYTLLEAVHACIRRMAKLNADPL